MIELRRAALDDAAALAELTTQLGYPSTARELRERLVSLLERDDHAVFVAVVDPRPVGWAHVGIERLLEDSAVACLHGLVVDEVHRSAGVGAELLRATEGWARDRGCRRVVVRSRIARERAHRFYLREGYELVKTSHVFGKSLV